MGSNCRESRRAADDAANPKRIRRLMRSLGCWVSGLIVCLNAALAAQAQTKLPDGAGRAVVERMCTTCHGVEQFTGLRMTKEHWSQTVDDMVARGAQGSDADINQVVLYLSEHFGTADGAKTAGAPEAVSKPADGNETLTPTKYNGFTAIQSRQRSGEDLTGVSFNRILNANKEPQNWLTSGGTYRSNHYSSLSQITPGNAKDLELKWVYQAWWLGPYENTPLVVDGVMYTTQGDDVVALDAATGRLFWIHPYTPAEDAKPCCGRIARGLAILGNTLFLGTVDAHLIALDAKTGNTLWDTSVAKASSGYSIAAAPLVVKDKVLIGVAGGEYGIRGFIAAFDAQTGKEAWRFHTIAGPGEAGSESWGGDSWKHGGGPIWTNGSYDPETNLTIWGVGNAGPDFNGDPRPGDNLYACSLVALDVDTGKLKWYYQANPHNEFDWDAVQIAALADVNWHGEPRKVLLWADRNGFFYVLDRTTGQFLLGKAFVKQTWNAGFDAKGRPIMSPNATIGPEGTLLFPDTQGGTNWFNPSFSPSTGLFYVNARENTSNVYRKGPQEYVEGQTYFAGGHPPGPRMRPPKPPVGADEEKYTALRAIDPQTGERKWQFKLNSGNSIDAHKGALTSRGAGGILTTASDVLFTGGPEGDFVVLDARNGSLLWRAALGGELINGPITYSIDGKQYVAIAAGMSLFVYGLR
jgi:alcohol dehydrogenase (cytochrome c)